MQKSKLKKSLGKVCSFTLLIYLGRQNLILCFHYFFVDDPRPLYLDAQATTPLDFRVLDAMLPYLTSYYGNPHSRTHAYGWESEAAMEKARAQIAKLIGADPKEIIFTSGATESNNISVKGIIHIHMHTSTCSMK